MYKGCDQSATAVPLDYCKKFRLRTQVIGMTILSNYNYNHVHADMPCHAYMTTYKTALLIGAQLRKLSQKTKRDFMKEVRRCLITKK